MYPTFVYSPQEFPLIPGSWVRCRFSAGTFQTGVITELDLSKPAFSLAGENLKALAAPSEWGNPFSMDQIQKPEISGSYPGDYVSEGQPYVLPIMGATSLTVSSPFKFRINPVTKKAEHHKGLDIAMPSGTPLVALADGEVMYTRNGTLSPDAGYYIVIKYEDEINGGDLYSRYLHMVGPSPKKKGDKVTQGEIVGAVGNTGRSTGPHLHFELGKKYPTSIGGTIGQIFDPVAYWPEGTYVTKQGVALVLETEPGGASST
jgi:murein DD-endopeptidase MepM/ murein hydrolase activator NlpD